MLVKRPRISAAHASVYTRPPERERLFFRAATFKSTLLLLPPPFSTNPPLRPFAPSIRPTISPRPRRWQSTIATATKKFFPFSRIASGNFIRRATVTVKQCKIAFAMQLKFRRRSVFFIMTLPSELRDRRGVGFCRAEFATPMVLWWRSRHLRRSEIHCSEPNRCVQLDV